MSIGRRGSTDTRRRRILVYQSSCVSDRNSSADRRNVEKLRQARRPVAIYGSSVNRRLRGRWFSLVPVRRRAMAAAALSILGTAVLLALAHWLAITWPPLAHREPLARPLRLDRPDSFGAWLRSALLVLAALTSLLVYQLRRYRNDDYRGSYRIWPPVIILIAISSVDGIVALVPWLGEWIDLLLGKRIAMAGSDWIRIVLTVGGAALALRMVAEVRHSKMALMMMLLSIICFATPAAARWGIVSVDTPLRWWLVTSAPLMAAATLAVGCGAYLRKLFREVRRIDEGDRLMLRFQQWWDHTFPRREAAAESHEPAAEKRAANKPKPTKPPAAPPRSAAGKPRTADSPEQGKPREQADSPEQNGDEVAEPRPSNSPLSWLLRWRRPKRSAADSATSSPADTTSRPAEEPEKGEPVNRRSAEPPAPEGKDDVEPAAAPPRRSGKGLLGRWFKGKRSAAAAGEAAAAAEAKPTEAKPAEAKPDEKPTPSRAAAPLSRAQRTTDEDDEAADSIDEDSIDWASMGKAERRRLRRELKRNGEAA